MGQGEWVWSSSRTNPPSSFTVYEDPEPELGRLLGPDGKVAKIVRPPRRPVGFQPEPKEQ